MIVSSRARYLLRVERWLALPLHWLLLILTVVAWWPLSSLQLTAIALSGLFVIAHTAVIVRERAWTGEQMVVLAAVSFALDCFLAGLAGVPSQPNPPLLHLLFAILTVRAITLAPIGLWALGIALLFWPVVVLSQWPWQTQVLPLTTLEAISLIGLAGGSLGIAVLYRNVVHQREKLRRDLSALREKSTQQEDALRRTSDRLGRQLLALRALEAGTRAISDAETQERILSLIAENCADVLNARAVVIRIPTDTGVDVITSARDLPEARLRTVTHLLQLVTAHDERMQRSQTAALGGSFIGIPLRSDRVVVGALGVVGQNEAHFDEHDLARLEAFSDQATLAITQARLYAQLAQAKRQSDTRLSQLEAINVVARATVMSLDVDVILERLLEQVTEVVSASHAAIYLLNREEMTLEPAIGDTPPVPVASDPALRRAFARARPVSVIVATSHEHTFQREFANVWGVQMYLIIPLVGRDIPIGAIYLGNETYTDSFHPEDIQVLVSLASFGAAAIENARLYTAVRSQSQQLEAVVRDIGDGVFVTDTDLQLSLINPKACDIFDLDTAPAPGTPLQDAIAIPDLITICRNVLEDAGGTPQIGELSVQRGPSTKKRTYQALASVVMARDEHPAGVVAVIRDVTAQKELEQMKSNFVSVISHELRTPLHSIGGFVDIILMEKAGPITDDQQEYLETVKEQTSYLNRLIEDLLEYNRLESGQIQLRLERVEIGELVHDIVETLRPVAENRSLQLENLVSRPITTIRADKGRLRQVFTNLVDNALKFTPAGGTVTISASYDETSVEVVVADTGIGIPPEAVDHVFEHFYQVDTGHTRQYHGAGLGLAIVKHIVVQHGGTVSVDSTVGEGSAFHVLLPVRPPEGELTIDFSRLLPHGKPRHSANE